jgi:hypothetical protein
LFELEIENNTKRITILEAIHSGADLSHADLSGADLRGANLIGANLDYSCLPLWCGARFKADKRICRQLVAHVLRIMELSVEGSEELRTAMAEYKSGWHREKEFGV